MAGAVAGRNLVAVRGGGAGGGERSPGSVGGDDGVVGTRARLAGRGAQRAAVGAGCPVGLRSGREARRGRRGVYCSKE